MADDIERAADRHGGDGVVVRTASGRDEEGRGVEPSHPVQPSPGAPLQQAEADVGGHAGQGRQRDPGRSGPSRSRPGPSRNTRVEEVGQPRGSAASHVRQAPGGDADAHRRPEDAGAEVGDAVGAQLGVGVGGAEVAVAALEVLDDRGGDQDVDRRDERQSQRRGQDVADIGRLPGEARERGSRSDTVPSGCSCQPSSDADGDGQGDAEQRRPATAAIAVPRRRHRPPRSCPAASAPIGPGPAFARPGASWPIGLADASAGEAGRPSSVRSWRITIIAPTPHEKPETTACGTLATCRPRRSTQKIIMKTEAARQTLAAPPIPGRHGRRDERHGGAGRPADQTRDCGPAAP